MSLPKPTGIKAPSKISKSATGLGQGKTGIPALGVKAQSAIAKSARSAGIATHPADEYAEEVSVKLPGPTSVSSSRLSTGPEPQPRVPPVDDFIIGDRVWVGGTKPGYIAFIGETQFAPGEWAGVVLDEPVGKNDGSVSGVRYFQCEAKRGVFARISKLSRTEGALSVPPPSSSAGRADGQTNGTKTPPVSNLAPPRSVTPKVGNLAVSRASSASTSSLNKASPPPSSSQLSNDVKHNFKSGDRVVVSGSKPGTLRYIGQTDFAKGIWAGVELDDPMGKNDGAVAGKRYFTCKPMYGLFAPVHKVAKMSGSSPSVGMTTPRSSKMPGSSGSALRSSRERSGSQESVSSISSSASSVSRSRAKAAQGGRPSSLNLSATTSALQNDSGPMQKALKEKEEHIEQLLRERDLERSEVARAAAQVDEAESQLANTKVEYDRYRDEADESVKGFKTRLAELEKEKLELSGKLEDEKRKTEDLQFQIEEESICKDDLEIRTEEDEAKVKELELELKSQRERADQLEAEVNKMKKLLDKVESDGKATDDVHTMYLDQIEELTHKLSQAENKIKAFETAKQEDGTKSSQLSQQLSDRSQRLTEVEAALDGKKRDLKQMESRLSELEDEVKTGQGKQQKLQSTIEELTTKLSQKEANSSSMNTEIQQLKNKFEDSQRQLEASKAKSDQIADDKLKLEQQIDDLMKNSGDSASQLSILNEQLRDKDRKLEEQLAASSNFTQKIAELETTLENLKQDHNRGVEEIISKHKEELKTVEGNKDDVQAEVEKLESKINQLLELHNQEKTELESSKQREITGLKESIQAVEDEKQKIQITLEETKKTMETLTTDNENIKFEKEKLERSLKKLEGERESLNDEMNKMKTELEEMKTTQGSEQGFEEKLKLVETEKEQILKEKQQLEKKLQESQADRGKLTDRVELLKVENADLSAHIQRQLAQVAKLEAEVSQHTEQSKKLKEKVKHQQEESKDLLSQIEDLKTSLQETQAKLDETDEDRERLRTENVTVLQKMTDSQQQFEGAKSELESSVKELQQRLLDVSNESESKQSSLQDSLDNMSSLLQQRDQEISKRKQQVEQLEEEKGSLQTYKTFSEKLELEKSALLKQVANLEKSLEEANLNAALINNPDGEVNPMITELQCEKESLHGQVEFLNSVIVELQNKNELLGIRLQAMESGDHLNGGIGEPVESPRVKAPRLFCDICDVFDKHETEDCPLQAMSDTETSAHSAHHGDKTAERAYCDICEVFGHWTSDCDDEQTF